MRSPIFILLISTLLAPVATAQSFKEQLQQGLYSEEVNNDLSAAITAYKGVVDRYDADRKIAATALFRLAECHRKNGDKKIATTLYNRLLRDFSDQTQLTAPALAQLGADPQSDPSASTARDIESREIDNLRTAFADSPDLINSKSDDGLFPIEKFAAAGQTKVVAYLLESGAQPDRTAALHLAILAGHKNTVTLLLDAGADPARHTSLRLSDSSSSLTLTPLHVAATTGNVAITKLLLEHEAPVDPLSFAPLGGSPGTQAANSGRPRVTGKNGAHVGPLSGERPGSTTPLHIAISNRFPALTEFLLAMGADPALKNANGQCSTHLAVRANEPGLVQLLLDNAAPVDPSDLAGYTPLLHAAYSNQTDLFSLLIQAGASATKANDDGMNAAYFAVDNNNLPLLKSCVSHSVPLDVTPEASTPLLHLAIGTHLGTDLLTTLLDAAADPDIPNSRSRRPLHLAAEINDAAAIDLLAAAGADIEARYNDSTPLMLAASQQQIEATTTLLKHGADVNARTQNGVTPFINLSSTVVTEASLTVATLLVNAGAHINATDGSGLSALHYAADIENVALVKYLLSVGADPLLRSNRDQWPLEMANQPETKAVLLTPTRNGAIELENQIFSYVPGDTSWRIPQTRAREGFDPFTLFELLHVVRDAAFTTATIVRLDPETRQVASQQEINLSDALTKGDASADVQLHWGDIVEYERRSEFDPGLTQQQADFLTAHMTRKINLTILYIPGANDPFAADKPGQTTITPARWVTAPDRKTMIPDFSPSYIPEKNELAGILTFSDALATITKHFDRKIDYPISLTRNIPLPDGSLRPTKIAGNDIYTPLSGYDTLTPLRTGDALDIALSADRPTPASSQQKSRTSGRRVILPPSR